MKDLPDNTTKPNVVVKFAKTPAEISAVQGLMRDLVDWLFARHHAYRDLVAKYFDPVEFDRELAALPGGFAAPTGALLIAKVDGKFAGCVGLRKLDNGICEMKRMYVAPEFHGLRVGEELARQLIRSARGLGYEWMRLDTGPEQFEARGLYHKLGFRKIAPYGNINGEMADWLTFMEKDLRSTD